MKIYIKASPTTYDYERVDHRVVTRAYLEELLGDVYYSLSPVVIKEIVDGIIRWKSSLGLCYHHIDANTHNNSVNNIALVSIEAHGFIHNDRIKSKFYRHFGLVNKPGYMQGLKAEAHENKMYNLIFQCMGGSSRFTVKQFANILIDVLDRFDFTSEDVYSVLSNADIKYLDYYTVKSILDNSPVDFNSLVEVDYVDTTTGNTIKRDITSKYGKSDDPFVQHSVDCILEFIDNNKMSRAEIRDYCKKLKN